MTDRRPCRHGQGHLLPTADAGGRSPQQLCRSPAALSLPRTPSPCPSSASVIPVTQSREVPARVTQRGSCTQRWPRRPQMILVPWSCDHLTLLQVEVPAPWRWPEVCAALELVVATTDVHLGGYGWDDVRIEEEELPSLEEIFRYAPQGVPPPVDFTGDSSDEVGSYYRSSNTFWR